VLYGMGFVTEVSSRRYRQWSKDAALAERLMRDNLGKTEMFMASQPSNRDLLNLVRRA
jgi:hypothetical protein